MQGGDGGLQDLVAEEGANGSALGPERGDRSAQAADGEGAAAGVVNAEGVAAEEEEGFEDLRGGNDEGVHVGGGVFGRGFASVWEFR